MLKKIIVLGGKGGVGKSTISAATAVVISDMLPNEKILLISFDMAHNLTDLFEIPIGNKLTRVMDNLWVIEPDPDVYAEEYTRDFAEKMRNLLKKMPIVGLIPQIKTFIDTTFTADSIPLALKNAMFFQKILDAEDINKQGLDFDYIVADFPPTGNMIALFDIPEDTVKVVLKYSLNFYNSIRSTVKNVSRFFKKVTRPFETQEQKEELGDEILKMLNELEERGEKISKLIHDIGSLRLVTIAEKASFEEIKRARELTSKYITLDAVHINMITPKSETCEFCQKVRTIQMKYISEIQQEFHDTMIWQSHKLQEEPVGIEGLRKFAREVYKDLRVEKILNPNQER
ncbi:MAG: ArsA family ATPase [Promethearchaeota archaeon]